MTELPLAAASRNVTTAPAFMPNASRPAFRPTPKPAPAYTKSNTAMGRSGRDAANVRAIPVNLFVRPDARPGLWRLHMESSGFSPFLQQLPYHLPILIVSLVGLSLSVIFWSRCPGPALLTLIATVLLLVTTVVVIGAQNYIISARL